jgi:23S rRNA (guanosine2251-2'-O)-methyltransferase
MFNKKNIEKFWVGGKHTVEEIIKNKNRPIEKILTTTESRQLIDDWCKYNNRNVKIENTELKIINKIFKDITLAHQGVAALIGEKKNQFNDIDDFLNQIKKKEKSTIVLLDNITDQRNIGSIIRTSAAFGVDVLFLERKLLNDKNPLLFKSASGTLELIDLLTFINLNNVIKKLKENNFWIVALDAKSEQDIKNFTWPLKTAIVLGSEGAGLKRLVKENCDYKIKIAINPNVESLNVANTLSAVLGIKSLK